MIGERASVSGSFAFKEVNSKQTKGMLAFSEERRHGANNSVRFKGCERLCLLQLTGEVEAAVPVALG